MRKVAVRAIRSSESRHLITRLRGNAARSSISLDTLPKVFRLCFPQVPIHEHRADGYFELPNKAQIWVGGLDDKDRVEKILGNEYATILFNECSQISYSSVLTALSRLAQNAPGLVQRAYYDLNPVGKGHWTNLQFIQKLDPATRVKLRTPDNYRFMFMNPKDNPHLSKEYLQSLMDMPERHRRRFFDGQYVDEVDGALWTLELIEGQRIAKEDMPEMRRIVVAVDPSGAASEDELQNDEIGIVVVGLGIDGNVYILEDCSLRAGPGVWGRRAVKAYHDWNADSIIAETNFGGEMVRFVIQAADRNVSVKVITASRGKVVRAEPVSALYEKKRVFHVGRFTTLEDQLCSFSTAGYIGEGSPDHADAAVWGVTELALPQKPGGTNMVEFMKREAEAQTASAKKPAPAAPHPAAGMMEHHHNTVYDLRSPRPAHVSANAPSSLKTKAGQPSPAAGPAKVKKKNKKVNGKQKKFSSFTAALQAQGEQ